VGRLRSWLCDWIDLVTRLSPHGYTVNRSSLGCAFFVNSTSRWSLASLDLGAGFPFDAAI